MSVNAKIWGPELWCRVSCAVQSGLRKSRPPSVLHVSLATVLISVFTLCYGPGLLFRGPFFRCQDVEGTCCVHLPSMPCTEALRSSDILVPGHPKVRRCEKWVCCHMSSTEGRTKSQHSGRYESFAHL